MPWTTERSLSKPQAGFFIYHARRTDGAVPPTLLDEASWATARFRPFMRMALTVAARRGMARQVSRWWRAEGAQQVPADSDPEPGDDSEPEDE